MIWKILHQGMRYEERGPSASAEAKKGAGTKDDPRTPHLGYRIELIAPAATA
jgi:hypothetical protein